MEMLPAEAQSAFLRERMGRGVGGVGFAKRQGNCWGAGRCDPGQRRPPPPGSTEAGPAGAWGREDTFVWTARECRVQGAVGCE